MLSISAMSAGSGRYYLDLAREDYYLKGGEPKGQWWGKGAEALKLTGTVGTRQLEALFRGVGPGGRELTQNAGAKDRQPGWDLTFSAPKSVSTLWSQAEEPTRHEIQAAHQEAVHAALSYLEQEVSFTRRGKGGEIIEKASLVVATFEHGVSRELDPQLHTHALVMNACTRADKTTGTLLSKPIYQHKMVAGALYRAELAAQLERRLGVVCERDDRSFAIKGVPQELNDVFSKRRAEILEALQSRGLASAAAAAIATLDTRRTKQDTPPRGELFTEWQRVGNSLGFELAPVLDNIRLTPDEQKNSRAAMSDALKALTESHSHFDKKQLLQELAIESQGRNLSANYIRDQLDETLQQGKDVNRLGSIDGEERYTTPEALKQEKELIRRADAVHSLKGHGAVHGQIEAVLKRYSTERSTVMAEVKHHASQLVKALRKKETTPVDREKLKREASLTLSEEQKQAVRYLTDSTGAGLRVLEGWAGTGKTSALRAAREIWENSGYRVVGVSVGGKAAKELAIGAGIESHTCAMLDKMLHPTMKDVLQHEATQVGRALKGKRRYDREPFKLDANTVLVIDEAGMCSTAQLNRLLADAKKSGAQVIALGDRDQLPAIGPGGGFAYLADRFGKAELKEIVRQNEAWMKEAVKQLAKGDTAAALKQFDLAGRLHVADNRDKAITALVSDWAKNERGREKESLIFVGPRREAHDINTRCQRERLATRDLPAGEHVTVTAAAVIDPGSKEKVAFEVYRGDRVLLTAPSRTLGVVNGDTGAVIGMKKRPWPASNLLTVKLDSGQSVSIPLNSYDGVRLGYCVTTHKGQGTTVERAYVLTGGSMTSRQLSYVQVSRAREATHLYTDKREAGPRFERLAKQMTADREKTFAHEVEAQAKQATKEREEPERERTRERKR